MAVAPEHRYSNETGGGGGIYDDFKFGSFKNISVL